MYSNFIAKKKKKVRMGVRMYRRELSPGMGFSGGAVSGYKAHATTRLRVVARDDNPATLVRHVDGTIRLVVATAQAVDLFIGLNELDIVLEADTLGTQRIPWSGLSSIVGGQETKFGTIELASYLGITATRTFGIVTRSYEVSREQLGMADNTRGAVAVREGIVQITGDGSTKIARQKEAEPFFRMNRYSPREGGTSYCRYDRDESHDESRDDGQEVSRLVGQHGCLVWLLLADGEGRMELLLMMGDRGVEIEVSTFIRSGHLWEATHEESLWIDSKPILHCRIRRSAQADDSRPQGKRHLESKSHTEAQGGNAGAVDFAQARCPNEKAVIWGFGGGGDAFIVRAALSCDKVSTHVHPLEAGLCA